MSRGTAISTLSLATFGDKTSSTLKSLNDGGVFTNSTTALPSEVVSITTRNRFVSQDLHDLDGDGYPDLILGADYYARYQALCPSGTLDPQERWWWTLLRGAAPVYRAVWRI